MKELVEQLDTAMTKGYEEYRELHKEFDTYRGRQLTLEDDVEVKRLLGEIYTKFTELYGPYHFIVSRYQFAVDQTNKYNDFTDSIKNVQKRNEEAGNA